MIGISGLAKSYGARTVFEDVSLRLDASTVYGVAGPHGSGKTTLLQILAGLEPASRGKVSISGAARVGLLGPDRELEDDRLIVHLAMMGELEVWRDLQTRKGILEYGEGDPTALADLERRLEASDGHSLEARASEVLAGLGIEPRSHRRPLSTLPRELKMRVLLAQVLVGGRDVLLLDEPTDHLDTESVAWLGRFLVAYRGTALVISCDRRFLDDVATGILEVDHGAITLYPGSYADFVARKQAPPERQRGPVERRVEPQAAMDDLPALPHDGPSAPAPSSSPERPDIERSRRAALPFRRDRVLADIALGKARKRSIHTLYGKARLGQPLPERALQEIHREERELDAKLEAWSRDLETITSELAAAPSKAK